MDTRRAFTIGNNASKKQAERLSPSVKTILDTQIKLEIASSHLYRAAGNWLNFNGYLETGEAFEKYSTEELTHANKITEYLMDKNCMPTTQSIESQPTEFKNYRDVITKAYEHEIGVTKNWNDIYGLALKEKDYSTVDLASWFLREQVEEEAKFLNTLDKLDMLDKEGVGILIIDEEYN